MSREKKKVLMFRQEELNIFFNLLEDHRPYTNDDWIKIAHEFNKQVEDSRHRSSEYLKDRFYRWLNERPGKNGRLTESARFAKALREQWANDDKATAWQSEHNKRKVWRMKRKERRREQGLPTDTSEEENYSPPEEPEVPPEELSSEDEEARVQRLFNRQYEDTDEPSDRFSDVSTPSHSDYSDPGEGPSRKKPDLPLSAQWDPKAAAAAFTDAGGSDSEASEIQFYTADRPPPPRPRGMGVGATVEFDYNQMYKITDQESSQSQDEDDEDDEGELRLGQSSVSSASVTTESSQSSDESSSKEQVKGSEEDVSEPEGEWRRRHSRSRQFLPGETSSEEDGTEPIIRSYPRTVKNFDLTTAILNLNNINSMMNTIARIQQDLREEVDELKEQIQAMQIKQVKKDYGGP
ncbi:hypothetical protein BCR43DRAFT_336438 [Syncephalastrum racemosum]|uniref:Myb-like domain-containing protein n=1 Tax=Syncephalastrum racemosum TaxID=13706 RepID=A0A1X2H8K6_SYNRA|nr:hypothetical protein BCR43DRAFT_336438 [Syncephalastrum racemosum]